MSQNSPDSNAKRLIGLILDAAEAIGLAAFVALIAFGAPALRAAIL